MVRMHEQKQTRRNQGEAHLPPPLTSLIQNPGAMSLWATWQPNNEQQLAVIVHRQCIFYDAMVSTPSTSIQPPQPPLHTAVTTNVAMPCHMMASTHKWNQTTTTS